MIDHPETGEFVHGAEAEAAYQRQQWNETDPVKDDADWFWTLGYVAGKALRPDISVEKKLHRIEAAAAVLANWHHAVKGRTA